MTDQHVAPKLAGRKIYHTCVGILAHRRYDKALPRELR